MGNSLEARKEIQYALLLRSWLELEADRGGSLGALWKDFTFLAGKLGFNGLTLTHRGTCRVWTRQTDRNDWDEVALLSLADRHEIHIGAELVRLELRAPQKMGEKKFQLLSELAAETWLHAARRWTRRNDATFALPDATTSEPQTNAAARPLVDPALVGL